MNLPIGEVVRDNCGKWKRTNHRDPEGIYPDNYYYMPLECY